MSESPVLERARAELRTHFGYPAFRPGQERAVESVLNGQDTLVVLPTGGGKSLCYQVPALMLPKLTVVISPLISLMKDQVDALTARGLPATFINSTLPSAQVADRLSRAQRGEFKLLYVAPERFDLGTTAERLCAAGVSLLAIDEAHCISEWGHDFRPSYLRLGQVRERLGNPPVVALTATATPHVRSDIVRQLKLDRVRTIITGFDRRNLTYHVVPTKSDQEKDDVLVQLIQGQDGLSIVYASTRKSVERIAAHLNHARIPTAAYHAGLDDAKRHEVQDAFMREQVRAIVATNAFGMGIDKPNVRLVVHHAMPGTLEAYYQEAGRAGRDGNPAVCYLLHAFPDRFTHEFFIKGAYPERALVEEVYDLLQSNASIDGGVELGATDISAYVRGKTSVREVESSLRLLAQCGAYRQDGDTSSRVVVRLLATPERIKRELGGTGGGTPSIELGLLRALWRAAGASIHEGAVIDLNGLPSGFGRPQGCIETLSALQQRQFLEWRPVSSGRRLADPRASLDHYGIDWALIERRRRADLAKLDAMQQYAYVKSCRRGFVLRYFGDPAATSNCGGCDNCMGVRFERAASKTQAKKHRASRTGATSRTAAADSHQADEYPELDVAGQRLLTQLRSLRTTIAREEQVPAYVVFQDRTLVEIASRRPKNLGALEGVRGVGPVKLERYGARFLEVVRDATNPRLPEHG